MAGFCYYWLRDVDHCEVKQWRDAKQMELLFKKLFRFGAVSSLDL